jgi:hypothetical protein
LKKTEVKREEMKRIGKQVVFENNVEMAEKRARVK